MTRREYSYRRPSFPIDLAKGIEERIKAHPELGYKTVSEFIRHASIEHLRRVDAQIALGDDVEAITRVLEPSKEDS